MPKSREGTRKGSPAPWGGPATRPRLPDAFCPRTRSQRPGPGAAGRPRDRARACPAPEGVSAARRGTTRASQGTCRLWGTAHGPQRRTPPRGPAPAAARGGDGRVRRRPFRNRKQNRGPWRSAPQSLAERTGYDVISKFRPADDPLRTKRLLPARPGPPGAPAASWAGGRPGPPR